MTRVLWLAKGLGRGGAEQLLTGSLPYVDRTRFDVDVAYLLPWKNAFVPALRGLGATVDCLECRHEADLRWMSRLRALVRDRAIDIVHSHMPYVGAGARIALLGMPTTIIHTEHNLWDRYRLPTRLANQATYERNAAVIAVSQAVANSITTSRFWPRPMPPIEVVLHGADLASIRRGDHARAQARDRLGLAPSAPVVGSVGNFTAKKDHATLLAAAGLLAREDPDLRVVLVGVGPLEEQLRARTRELGLERNVLFTGLRDDVYEILPAFDVFALSSRYEGLPIALLEAMATGVACVATSVGGIPEVIVDGEHGILVEPGDPAALGAALGKLLANPDLRASIGDAAATRAAAFDLRSAVERTQEIYEQAVAG